jgi:hypothetical protein
MKKQNIILGCIILSLFSCKPKQSTKKTNKKKRRSLEQYSLDSAHYKSVGKYKNDDPIKSGVYYLDGKIIKKKKHTGNIYTNFIIKTEKYNPRDNSFEHQHQIMPWFPVGRS